MSSLNKYIIKISMSNEEGVEVAQSSLPFEDLEKFRKQTGSSGSLLIEQIIGTLADMALIGPKGIEPNKVLPVRKPGQENFNR